MHLPSIAWSSNSHKEVLIIIISIHTDAMHIINHNSYVHAHGKMHAGP